MSSGMKSWDDCRLPQGINNRLMSLRPPLWGGKLTTIVSVYASTPSTNPDAQILREPARPPGDCAEAG
nr:unnamed protein product [Spirometra erinaceieuropaei]